MIKRDDPQKEGIYLIYIQKTIGMFDRMIDRMIDKETVMKESHARE